MSTYEYTQVGKLFAETNEVRGMRNALVHGWTVLDPLTVALASELLLVRVSSPTDTPRISWTIFFQKCSSA